MSKEEKIKRDSKIPCGQCESKREDGKCYNFHNHGANYGDMFIIPNDDYACELGVNKKIHE